MAEMAFYKLKTLYGKFSIFLALVTLLIFLAGSESFGGKAEGEYYSVQVSSHKKYDSAAARVETLKAQGHNFSFRAVNIPGRGKWHRVFTGKYESRDDALKAGKELREKGVIKDFTILRTESGNKTVASQTNREDNENTPPPHPGLIKTPPPPVPALTKGESAPTHKDRADTYRKTGRKSYDSAMSDFASGRYEDALTKFKEIVGTGKDEPSQRRMADCLYFLGENGDNRYFSKAIDQYRDIIRSYPGSKKENTEALYRLATSYSRLNLYYEALVEFNNLYSDYPESAYAEESLYMAGDMFYKTEKFDKAIEKFKGYIKKFPDGKYVRDAHFGLGNCYSRMRQFNDADTWYAGALKKCPTLEDIPEDTLSKLGTHYLQIGKHDDALRIFFAYLNLFPGGKHYKDILYTTARSFEKTGQLPLALKMLSIVIERYPESREARESAFVMANIGVKDPEIKLSAYILPGMDNYGNPIEAYDKMAGKFSDIDMEEELMFRKGEALVKRGRYREAFESCRVLPDKFPYGKHKKAGEKNLVVSAGHLIDGHYSKKDYIAVSEVYFNADKKIVFENGNFDMLFKIGISLKNIGLLDQAAEFFEEMTEVYGKDKRINKLLLATAEIDKGRGSYEGAKRALKKLPGKQPAADKKTVITVGTLMGDILYKEGLFKEAADSYSEVLGFKADVEGIDTIRKKYADSIKEMGLYSSALVNYKRVLKNYGGEAQNGSAPLIIGSYEGLGDCLFNEGKYSESILMYEKSLSGIPEGEQKMWTIFNIGRGYTNLGNKPMADKSFGSLKGEGGDEFWSRVVDYYIADRDWTEKYKDI